ncbi:hypothetical protein BO78DRAFT_423315 [Aspergillus sclerotiicarbonarius CBS 121057]|uniref:Uncharacterized protein n=1 Tax=Aspergillus sclerotiicarbonarius (strain CBS 121057 / IBT 28362) TaxID=1448318 RepID=A0A319E4Z8_ASPSB|nr:hypothetical protein BO78DRAFT_423315 [Aspergillus sclerotiicarbonarius CBS 121057]
MASQKIMKVLLGAAAAGLTYATAVPELHARSCTYTVNTYDCFTDGDSTAYRELTTTQLDNMISHMNTMLWDFNGEGETSKTLEYYYEGITCGDDNQYSCDAAMVIHTLEDDYIGTCVIEESTAVFSELITLCGRAGGWLDLTYSNGAEWMYEWYATTGADTACSYGGDCITVDCSAFDDCANGDY